MKSRVVKRGNFWVGEVHGEWTHMKDGKPEYTWTGWKRITSKNVVKRKTEEELTQRLILKSRMEKRL